MWRWNCSCFMDYTQCKSLLGTGAGKKEVGDTQASLDFFLPRYFPENLRVHSQVAVYFMIFQLRSYSGDPDKSTGVLGNIYGPVLCYGRKGQTEKKGGHLPYTLHLSLSCQLSQWVMQTLIWLDDWLHYHFFLFLPALQISLKWQWSIVHYKLSIRAMAFALLLY